MSRKFLSLTAGALLSLGLAGTAFAAGPVTLTGSQMDKVTAGWGWHVPEVYASAFANATAVTVDNDKVAAITYTNTVAIDNGSLGNAAASTSFSKSVVH